ncbi:MAG: hypothetical protein LBM02_01975 [Lachnospiraceae bacterium]|jgi:Skp family chaperone for outer membrane proteins|nr:hypothetical protein [Lachnospiraceae bacterium]
MNRHVEKISEIEMTAEAIVAEADDRKKEVEREIQTKRDKFDADLEKETLSKLNAIKLEHSNSMNAYLAEQKEKNRDTIEKLKQEYEDHHSEYAAEILKRITSIQN